MLVSERIGEFFLDSTGRSQDARDRLEYAEYGGGGIVLDTLDQRSGPTAAVVHGLFFGRIASSSRQRRVISAPALVVGHLADPSIRRPTPRC